MHASISVFISLKEFFDKYELMIVLLILLLKNPSSIMGARRGVANETTLIPGLSLLSFFVYTLELIVPLVPITPTVVLRFRPEAKFSAKNSTTGSMTFIVMALPPTYFSTVL